MKTKIIHCISIATTLSALSGCAVDEPIQEESQSITDSRSELAIPESKGTRLIEWEVTTPFRLFKDQKHLDQFIANKEELKSDNPIQTAEKRLSEKVRSSRLYITPYDQTFYNLGDLHPINDKGRSVPVKNKMTYEEGWVTPKNHLVKVGC